MTDDIAIDSSVRALARELLGDVEALTDELVELLLRQPGTYAGEDRPVTVADLRTSCRLNLERIVQSLVNEVPPGLDPLEAPRRTGAARAEQRVPLETVLRSFRFGGSVTWNALVRRARSGPTVHLESLLEAATGIWAVIDAFSQAVADAYRATEADLARREERLTAALLITLIEGTHTGPLAQAAEVLRLEQGPYVTIVSSVDAAGREPLSQLRLDLSAHGQPSAWAQRGALMVGIVAVARDADRSRLRALLSGPNVQERVGVSWPFATLAQTAEAFRAAVLALRTVPPGEGTTAWLEEHLLAAMVVQSDELAARLRDRVLGPVLELPRHEREPLVETLTAFLTCTGNTARTAEVLYCHRNTVINRLRRYEQLTGTQLQDGSARLALGVALTALRVLVREPE